MLKRNVNVGFSGGEKKRNEVLQMAILRPKLAILDETDSGLDIDALRIVADGVNALRGPDFSALVITHHQRLLDHLVPDRVHVLSQGRIIRSGGPELARELEANGYAPGGGGGGMNAARWPTAPTPSWPASTACATACPATVRPRGRGRASFAGLGLPSTRTRPGTTPACAPGRDQLPGAADRRVRTPALGSAAGRCRAWCWSTAVTSPACPRRPTRSRSAPSPTAGLRPLPAPSCRWSR